MMADADLHPAIAPASLERRIPRIGGVMTIFYYDSIASVVGFYEDLLRFERVLDHGWVTIFRIRDGCFLALVEGDAGSQTAIAGTNKGAMLSIEADDLAGWHNRLRESGADFMGIGLDWGCDGRTIEFRVRDPGGYTIEFLEWVDPPPGWT
jgi:catechol 2,3-dioxygenase-like lactoylglutathione lyase family enzyme